MISVYERGQREPSLATLLKLLHAAGFELTMQLEPYDRHDEVLGALESRRSPSERRRREREIDAWRRARPVEAGDRVVIDDVEVLIADLDDVIRSKEAAGRPKDLRVLPTLYRHRQRLRA